MGSQSTSPHPDLTLMNSSLISRRALLSGAAAAALTTRAQTSNSGTPSNGGVLRVVTSFQPGAGTESLLRLALAHISKASGRSHLVDNKPGADGMLAAGEVLRSPANGSTLLCVANTTISGVAALKKEPPYDSRTAFAGISLLGFYTIYLFASKDAPFDSVGDLLRYGRSHPGEVRIGESGFSTRIAAVKLAQTGNFQLTEVPYKGEPALLSDILSGRIQLAFTSPAVLMPYVKAGKLKVLATAMANRSKAEPGVITMTEAGLPGFDGAGWSGIFGAKGFPQVDRQMLADAFATALLKPDVVALADQIGFSIKTTNLTELDRFVAQDIAATQAAVRKAGIPLE